MSEPNLEQKIDRLSATVDSMFLGIKVFLFLFLIFGFFGNLTATLSIGKYQEIFADALPGGSLPYLTMTVLEAKSLLIVLVYVWPIAGLVAVFIRRRVALSLLLFCAALLCTVLQYAIVVLAMQLPTMGLLENMAK